jgi:hypothetical protein
MLQLLHRCSFYSQPSLRTPIPQSYYYYFLPFLQDLEIRNGYLDRNAQNSQSLLQAAVSRLQLPPGLRFSADPAFVPKVKKKKTQKLSLTLSLSLSYTRIPLLLHSHTQNFCSTNFQFGPNFTTQTN